MALAIPLTSLWFLRGPARRFPDQNYVQYFMHIRLPMNLPWFSLIVFLLLREFDAFSKVYPSENSTIKIYGNAFRLLSNQNLLGFSAYERSRLTLRGNSWSEALSHHLSIL